MDKGYGVLAWGLTEKPQRLALFSTIPLDSALAEATCYMTEVRQGKHRTIPFFQSIKLNTRKAWANWEKLEKHQEYEEPKPGVYDPLNLWEKKDE